MLFSPNAVHTMPINDLIAHQSDQTCLCQPTLNTHRLHPPYGPVIGYTFTHHAWDARESWERADHLNKIEVI